MAFTITSKNTFSIPADIKDNASGATATLKRVSANGAVPVILEGSANIRTGDQIKPQNYVVYTNAGVTRYMKIDSVTVKVDGTYEVILQNPLGVHWDVFPTAASLVQWAAGKNYFPHPTDTPPTANFFYSIQSNSTENLVFDVSFTKGGTNLTLDIYTLNIPVTKELVRTEEIYNIANYIHEVYDSAGSITKRTLTISTTGTYRIPLDVLLVDQILLVVASDTTANLNMGLDVRENTLGSRYPLNFYTV
jgi:hypothetical protein